MAALAPVLAFAAPVARAQDAIRAVEPPYLAAAVREGALPPVDQRLPKEPAIVDMSGPDREPGRHGGRLETLMAKPKDVRLMTVYGYARLVAYNEEFELVPDILASYDVEEGRIFTLRLRKGHRWSDGHPFTSEDFRYFWEDMALNEDLAPIGPPRVLIVEGERPNVEVLDETTVRYSWSKPNPDFLTALAAAAPLFIYRPSHYLKQFHEKYQDLARLEQMVDGARQRNWAALHTNRDRQYHLDNPDLPTLQPWYNTVEMPSERFTFVRNPYYHRIDRNGLQLPYVDEVIVKIAYGQIIAAKTSAGESDLQTRYLHFNDYTVLKKAEDRSDFTVRLWKTIKGSQFALYPNLNAEDPVWRDVIRDVRFRRALSLAIDRHEINQIVYFGLGREGNNTILEESPLFKPEYRDSWARFDLAKANRLLDEAGFTRRDGRGVRLLPDDRPMEIIVDTAGEATEETDVLALIHDSWLKAGIKLYARPSQREVFRNRVFSGQAIMSVWSGLTNGMPTADMSPHELAPTRLHQFQWPKFGKHFETDGQSGTPPDMPIVKQLRALYLDWRATTDRAAREKIWQEMLSIHAEQVFTIGVVNGLLQPVVVANGLMNVPEEGIINWDPGAVFGMYKPDTFWFADAARM